MMLTYKFRIHPSKKQERMLKETLEKARFAYNKQLEFKINAYKTLGKNMSNFELNNHLITLKQEHKFLNSMHSQVLQNINQRISFAFNNFYNNIKNKAGFPRFKSKNRYDSITYPQSGFGIKGNMLCLSKIGEIKIKLHREIKGKIKNIIVKRTQTNKWHAYFCSEIEVVKRKNDSRCDKTIGIDLGLESFYADSNGNLAGNPRCLRTSENKLAMLQRNHSRKKLGSRNRLKSRIKVAKMHERIANQRNDFLHKESRKLALKYSNIAVEDLKIKNMARNKYLAKSIADASWNRFIQMLSYKVEETGGNLKEVNPWGTSQYCICGNEVPKKLSTRIHRCSKCDTEINRDVMSAMLIKKLAFDINSKTTAGSAESNAWGDVPIGMPMNQESQGI